MSNFTLELPEDLRRQLELAAKSERRSLGQQVVFLLEQHFPKQAKPDDVINKEDPQTEKPQ